MRATRHIVKVINPLDLERNMPTALYKREVSAWICNLWQFDDSTILDSIHLQIQFIKVVHHATPAKAFLLEDKAFVEIAPFLFG